MRLASCWLFVICVLGGCSEQAGPGGENAGSEALAGTSGASGSATGGTGQTSGGSGGVAGSPQAGASGAMAAGGSAGSGAGGTPLNAGASGSAGEGGGGSGGSSGSSGASGTAGIGAGSGGATGGTSGAAGAAAGSAGTAGMAGMTGTPKIVLVAGTGTGGDGTPATSAAVLNPYGAVVDPLTGEVYVAEVDTGKIRRIDASGIITTVVGPGAPGEAADIELNQPHDLLFQPNTHILFIADTMNGNVYRLDAELGEVAQFVGPNAPFPGVSRVYCLAFSPSGRDLYFTGPDDIRVIDLDAMEAKPAVPYASARVIALDSQGTLYAVKNRPNGTALQVVDAEGNVTDMPATVDVVDDPKHITLDLEDNVLLADTELQFLRKYVVATDTLVDLVGNGMVGTGTLGGAPEDAQLSRPHGVFVDLSGVIYISDSENDRVLKIVRE